MDQRAAYIGDVDNADQRRTFGDPETAVREAYSAALGVLGGGCVMREPSHDAQRPCRTGYAGIRNLTALLPCLLLSFIPLTGTP